MKQLLVCSIVGLTAVMPLVSGPSSANAAAPAYGNASLDGAYQFMQSEIYQENAVTMYCEGSGTMDFDGASAVAVSITARCSDGVTATITTNTVVMNYAVNPDGSFIMTEPDETHGPFKIVQNGNGFVTDYSTATTSSPEPYKLLWSLSAFKKEGKFLKR